MTTVSNIRRTLLLGMFLLSAGGLVLHYSWHSPLHPLDGQGLPNSVAFSLNLLDAVLVTFLFSRKKTASWAYLLNGLLAVYGTVFMTHFGWSAIVGAGGSLFDFLLHPTAPEILILWADFFAGAALYRLWFVEPASKG